MGPTLKPNPKHKNLSLAIIIPTTGQYPFLLTLCLYSAQTAAHLWEGTAYIVVVVDNPQPTKYQQIRKLCQTLNVQCLPSCGRGVAHARNTGAHTTNAHYLLFLDDDILLHPTHLCTLARIIQALNPHNSQRTVINLNWITPQNLLMHWKGKAFLRYLINTHRLTRSGWIMNTTSTTKTKGNQHLPSSLLVPEQGIGGAYLIPRHLFQQVGGFDDSIPFSGFEDRVLTERLLQAGARLLLLTQPVALHYQTHLADLNQWFARIKRGAATLYFAQNHFPTLQPHYPWYKHLLFQTGYHLLPVLLALGKHLPDHPILQPLAHRLFHFLTGIAFYRGYHHAQDPSEPWFAN